MRSWRQRRNKSLSAAVTVAPVGPVDGGTRRAHPLVGPVVDTLGGQRQADRRSHVQGRPAVSRSGPHTLTQFSGHRCQFGFIELVAPRSDTRTDDGAHGAGAQAAQGLHGRLHDAGPQASPSSVHDADGVVGQQSHGGTVGDGDGEDGAWRRGDGGIGTDPGVIPGFLDLHHGCPMDLA